MKLMYDTDIVLYNIYDFYIMKIVWKAQKKIKYINNILLTNTSNYDIIM